MAPGTPKKAETLRRLRRAPRNGDFRDFRDCRDHTPREVAFLSAAQAAAEALAEPDPDLGHERAEIAAALDAEAGGRFGPSVAPEQHQKAVAGLLRGFLNTGPQPTLEMLA